MLSLFAFILVPNCDYFMIYFHQLWVQVPFFASLREYAILQDRQLSE